MESPRVAVCEWPAVVVLSLPDSPAAVWDGRLQLKIAKNPQPIPVSGHAGTKSWDLPVPVQISNFSQHHDGSSDKLSASGLSCQAGKPHWGPGHSSQSGTWAPFLPVGFSRHTPCVQS
eukprot:TRINITY_DN35274_c0_g1_i1.p1 TRINITY_DN35274_c0_g1~~TRINITY_DN35274_c0_g1_i1.p1  ORF type:complete len:118 (+),score=21.29 TRINITY_DN35274_c0_g1_i1:125-478(+)